MKTLEEIKKHQGQWTDKQLCAVMGSQYVVAMKALFDMVDKSLTIEERTLLKEIRADYIESCHGTQTILSMDFRSDMNGLLKLVNLTASPSVI